MIGVLVVDITKNNYNILATIDLTSYTSLKDLYEDLLTVKKDVFADDERIIIIYNTDKQKKLIDELLLNIDISDFFVIFEITDNHGGLDFNFSDSFCIYPWINLRISSIGNISSCCMAKSFANLNQTVIKDAYQGSFMQDLRRRFLSGEKPDQCSFCWKEEAVGKTSMRQRATHKFKEIYYQLDYQKENIDNLQVVELNLGNSCNLGCKICDSKSSSTIAKKDLADGNISTVEFQLLKQSVKWAESAEFWKQLVEIVHNIKYLDLYGGEPLMSKEHFRFLKKLIELDVAKNIKIDYNSNATIYSEHFFDLWQQFKEIKISFSIDDINDRFEAQRVGAKWSHVCENIVKYNARKSELFITEVYPTINTQNVFYLPELLEWIGTQNFDSASFNVLHYPMQYNILSLDDINKRKIIEKLRLDSNDICKSIVTLLENSFKGVDE